MSDKELDALYNDFNKMSKQQLIRELLYLHEVYLSGGEE